MVKTKRDKFVRVVSLEKDCNKYQPKQERGDKR
jgi:hypothetical protein